MLNITRTGGSAIIVDHVETKDRLIVRVKRIGKYCDFQFQGSPNYKYMSNIVHQEQFTHYDEMEINGKICRLIPTYLEKGKHRLQILHNTPVDGKPDEPKIEEFVIQLVDIQGSNSVKIGLEGTSSFLFRRSELLKKPN